ncbi:hypothetical protein ZIOFF_013696 [Zingiber officinale]|uniref:dUTP diphosphatase n=1 Tax=Zingiber officinale TaxID=94328 RepID=A0A8J5HMT0_ZINOF|nr:hypothetical protein ZIOFF_013696 [Zingiber officinale]
MIIEEFLDRIPQGIPGGTWYEFYGTDSEQNDEQQNDEQQNSDANNWVSETSQLTTEISNLNIHQNTEPMEEQEAAHVQTEQILEQLEYPIFRKLVQNSSKEKAFASTSDSAISHYRQPNEPLMGQINYPPAQGTTPQFTDNGPYKGKFKGKALDHQAWTLPSAQQTTGAMLVLPEDIGKEVGATFEFLKIRRLTETAKIPERRTKGAAGFDIFLDEAVNIPARDRKLVKTGICLEFPEGHYARLAVRSGASSQLKLDVGAGVIDAPDLNANLA